MFSDHLISGLARSIPSFTGLTIVDLSFWNQIVLTFLFYRVDHNVVVYLYFESDAFDAYCLSNTPSVGLLVVSCSIIITSSATSSCSSTALIAASLSSMKLNHVNIYTVLSAPYRRYLGDSRVRCLRGTWQCWGSQSRWQRYPVQWQVSSHSHLLTDQQQVPHQMHPECLAYTLQHTTENETAQQNIITASYTVSTIRYWENSHCYRYETTIIAYYTIYHSW